VLKSMLHFLRAQGYLSHHPVVGVAMPRNSSRALDPRRSLNPAQLAFVVSDRAPRKASPARDQLAWAIRFLYGTGPRISEFTHAAVDSLRWVRWIALR
jgi:site-specific recombinase XerD